MFIVQIFAQSFRIHCPRPQHTAETTLRPRGVREVPFVASLAQKLVNVFFFFFEREQIFSSCPLVKGL